MSNQLYPSKNFVQDEEIQRLTEQRNRLWSALETLVVCNRHNLKMDSAFDHAEKLIEEAGKWQS